MRRRLDLAGALVADPPVLFLDEPTTGLDPRSRTDMWEVIQSLVAGGTTLLLTTQYLEEADLLADEIVVIDHGRVIAQGTADQLKAQVGGERLAITVAHHGAARARPASSCSRSGCGAATVEEHRRSTADAGHRRRPRSSSTRCAASTPRRSPLDDVGLRRPTLDDVFLTLTGHAAEDADQAPRNRPRRGRDRASRGDEPMSVSTAVSDGFVVAKRNLIKIKRVPDLLVFTTLSPIMFVLLFAYVFGGAIDTAGGGRATASSSSPGSSPRPSSSAPPSPAPAWPRTSRRASSTGSGRCRCRPRRS